MSEPSGAVVWDTVALLHLFDTANQAGSVDGDLKVQKLTFLGELAAQSAGIRAAGFRFFRYKYGPYCGRLDMTVESLEGDGIITDRRVLTSRGRYILDYTRDEIAASAGLTKAVASLGAVATRYASMSGTSLKELVYEMTVPVSGLGGELVKVLDVPLNTDILDPASNWALPELPLLSADTVDEIACELRMSEADLDPSSPGFQHTIGEALRRLSIAC